MKPETRSCQNCKQDFIIETDDFLFYEKVNVPAPTWCIDCRQQRRYAWRNERNLYRRSCDLCGKSTVTIYSPNKNFKVYCTQCWWGDVWDAKEYGVDFDFTRPFFEQFSELQHKVPRMALLNKNSINSEYTNHSGNNKNVYLSFVCFGCENVSYSAWVLNSRDSLDCSYVYDKGERIYECVDSRSCYKTQYSVLMKDCSDCLYCYDCHGSINCFMSSNLRNKSYVFRGQQLSKEEYQKKIQEIDFGSFAVRSELQKEYNEMFEQKAIHKFIASERNFMCVGSSIFNSKNTTNAFDCDSVENCKNIYSAVTTKDSMDVYHIGYNSVLCYEIHASNALYDGKFSHLCYDCSGLQYCDSCQNSQNLFGCVSVKKGEYMIFNKKYTKEEYAELKNKIIEYMKKTGEYGEFFPPSIAPVAYNETQGNIYMPLSKEEVLKHGWQWEDNTGGTFGKETIYPENIVDNINDMSDFATKEIYKCISCTKNFNITPDELSFYKREIIPIPRSCADCRYKRRFEQRPPRKLWHRTCMCKELNHGHNGICTNKFETPYSPDRSEKVYCESCYQKEVI